MTLIEEMRRHISNENINIFDDLSDIIADYKIKTVDELKNYQKEFNKRNGEYLSDEHVLDDYINEIDNSISDGDGLLFADLQRVLNGKKLLHQGSTEEKIYYLIIYCSLTNRVNPFPYYTYLLITEDKL